MVLPTGRLFGGRRTETESTEKVVGSEICARILAEFPKKGRKGAEFSYTDFNLTWNEFSLQILYEWWDLSTIAKPVHRNPMYNFG